VEGLILALDASTYQGSVAIMRGRDILAERTIAMRGKEEERLMPAIADALENAGAGAGDVTGVVCGAGPGSFTSLRIAASLAKGIAHARRVPLFAVPSLALAAIENGHGRWCLTMDALRGEVFVAAYAWDGTTLTTVASLPSIVAERDIAKLATTYGLVVRSANPHARAAAPLLHGLVREGGVDLAQWEPNYGRLAEAQVRWESIHGPLPS
jgi:tRNA threonylcarbamoyladenosine biosynthesis protein TsaB